MTKKIEYLDVDSISAAARLLDFETAFYKKIVDNSDFKIIPIPTFNNEYLDEQEKQDMIIEAMQEGIAVIYQILLDNGDYVVIGMNPVNLKIFDNIGYIPANMNNIHDS